MELQRQKVLMPNIFQQEALQKLEETKKDRGVVVMPTGTGKTFLASLWFKKQLEANPKAKLLFICHNKDILSQANEKEFQRCLKDFGITYGYYSGIEKHIRQATFGTVQTLSRNLNKFEVDNFDYIIVDEAHHYQAKSFKKVLEYFKPTFMLGLTATPNRLDGLSIFKVLGNKIYDAKISTAIKKGLLTKINYYCVDNDIDFSDVKWNGSTYDKKDLNKKICVREYDDAILKEYRDILKKKFGKNKTICFCATVEHCYRMEELFNRQGIKSVALTGKYEYKNIRRTIHSDKRDKIINGFKDGKYDIIFVRDLFNEGVDVPDCDSVMMLRPTQSHTIFTQQIGRGLRKSEDKEDVLILDFTGNARKCTINLEVLEEMLGCEIINKVYKNKLERKEVNEIVILKNGCRVRLNRSKINIINNGVKIYDKDAIVFMYKLVKANSKNKIITKKYFIKESEVTENNIRIHFKSWKSFLISIGEKREGLYKPTKKQVIEKYWSFKKDSGKQPRAVNIYHGYYFPKYWGSYNNFLKEIGEPVILEYEKATKDELTAEYFRYKKMVGRQPLGKEFEMNKKYGVKYNGKKYKKVFGGWKEFLKEIGEPLNQNNVFAKDITEKELLDNLKELKDKLQRDISWRDLRVKRFSKYGADKYTSKIGKEGVQRMFKKVNGKYRELNIPVNILIDELKEKARVLEHIPSRSEFGNRAIPLSQKLNLGWEEIIKLVFGIDCDYKFTNINKKVKCKVCEKDFIFKKSGQYRNKDRLCCSKLCANRYIGQLQISKKQSFDEESMIEEYGRVKKLLNRIPLQKDFEPKEGVANFHMKAMQHKFKTFGKFREKAEESINRNNNIKITSKYKPKTIIIPTKQKRSGKGKSYPEGLKQETFKSTEDKTDIREKIISKIENGDKVLLLESPELSALKEIEKQNKKPNKIIIPNDKEFKQVAEALRNYKTDLKIELINTSALQYLIDSEEKFDFVWLDYCGAFSYYMKDLDILFQKHLNNMRLVLTYNLFDPAKDDDSYYFTRVIDYVLGKTEDKKVRLINDITHRYKKQMYNLGFNIQ